MNDKLNNRQDLQKAENKAAFSDLGDLKTEAVVKRTEKIVSAVLLVTNLISDNDSIKWAIRDSGVSLLRKLFPAGGGSLFGREEALLETLKTISESVSLIEVGRLSKLISEMNAAVIKNELESLRNSIEDINRPASSEFILAGLFGNGEGENYEPLQDASNLLPQKGIPKDTASKGHFYKGHHQSVIAGKKTSPAKHIKDKKNAVAEKDARKTDIINLFKKNKELMIKDISSAISGCSEKTIQRELNTLLKDKVIKKTGEKRWSKYYLNRV